MLRIDSNIIWTIINLLILYFFMMKFLFKPVRNIINQRNEEINASFKDVENQKKQAQQLKEQADQQLQNMNALCDEKLASAKAQASQEYERIIADANAKSNEILENTRKQTQEVAQAEQAKAQAEIANMIDAASKKITDQKSDEKLYDDFFKEME